MSKSKNLDDVTIEEIIDHAHEYIDDEEQLSVIKRAYLFAKEKHQGQFRKSGEAYIYHPMNVALILTTIYADFETIAAGLLHDVLEDCDCSAEEMEKKFGSTITKLVQGVTKLSKIHFSTENEYLIDYYKKIIVGMSEDVRVIIVKLADRLHNMRTLWAIPEDRQKVKAKESLEILAPIADHLGIHKIKSELEDLALRYLKPDVFYDIAEKLNKTKCIYSIYNKLNKGKKFNEIYDLLALRVIVNTEQECYLALGLIHSKFRPLPKRFKDYIAMPKPNMYQSLHTTVFGIGGDLFEIQIRTHEMDEVAENGIAAHWSYKENKGSDTAADLQNTTEQKLQFFKSIIDLSHENINSEEFVNSVKDEVLNNNIYCYTPKGDVIELPKGATPIDFAYRIHTKVGETTVGAIVNNNIVPLDYELHDNDIVKINTNKNSTPSKEWINFVKSTQVRNKIKSYFTKSDRENYIERGKYNLEKELRKRKLSISEFTSAENIKKICDAERCEDLEDIYLSIGNGKLPVNSVINIIDKPAENISVPKTIKVSNKNKDADIIVSGIDKVKVNLANCCNPVYGDPIVGYITKGNGITVHLLHCHNLSMLENRTIEVKWNSNINKRYLTILLVYTNDNENHMLDLMQLISMMNVSVDGIKTVNRDSNNFVYEVNCYVTGKAQLDKLMLNINKADYVDRVEREMR